METQEQSLSNDRFKYPVSARFDGHDWKSHGLAHEDYSRMSTHVHVLNSGRSNDCPEWTVNTATITQVVVRFMEMRSGMRNPNTGTIRERIERAEQRIKRSMPKKRAQLLQLCKKQMEAHGEARKKLATLCENLDTQIVIAEMGARLVTGVISYYHLQGWNSVDTAHALGLKPPHVRQIVYRLNRCWKEICGTRCPVTHNIVERACKKCGKKFIPTRGLRQKFCSRDCSASAYAKIKAPFECGYCLKVVVPVQGQPARRKYCSVRCGALAFEAANSNRHRRE
jgi:hypothetical protein